MCTTHADVIILTSSPSCKVESAATTTIFPLAWFRIHNPMRLANVFELGTLGTASARMSTGCDVGRDGLKGHVRAAGSPAFRNTKLPKNVR